MLLLDQCTNGQTYNVVTNSGNNHASHPIFDPAFDVTSTTVLIPTRFLGGTQTFMDASGTTVLTLQISPAAKGNSMGPGDALVTCRYSFSFVFTITSTGQFLPPGTYTSDVVGHVEGFIPSQK